MFVGLQGSSLASSGGVKLRPGATVEDVRLLPGESLEELARKRSSWPSPLGLGELDLAGDAGKKGGGTGQA
ncbi:hypothetical protein ZWY2020_017548 [Hordeum vulgare]|nr:hypothetical protein ZWY2020_017548 [Hordeum vulgare]